MVVWHMHRLAFLAAISASLAISGPVTYTITNLGTITPGGSSNATGINDAGQVVGSSNGRAFLWAAGVMSQVPGTSAVSANARGINNAGQIVGFNNGLGFLYDGVTTTTVGPNNQFGSATAINAAGAIVGTSMVGAWLWEAGSWAYLPAFRPFPDFSRAEAINTAGDIAGSVRETAGDVPVQWLGGSPSPLGLTPGGSQYASAAGINDLNEIVGTIAVSATETRPFLFRNGAAVSLDTLGGLDGGATDINNRGQVVGYSSGRAFLYEEGSMHDLNQLVINGAGWQLTHAAAINEQGQIVGRGVFGGQTLAVLLTPTPEPASLLTALAGLIATMKFRGKARRKAPSTRG